MTPTKGLEDCLIQYLLPEILHSKVGDQQGDNLISTPSVHPSNWPPELKK
jgi:hypothetical protein